MSGDRLDREAMRRRAEAATPGPWSISQYPQSAFVHAGGGGTFGPARKPDAEFIAHARTDVPALLDALGAAEAEVDRLRAVLASAVRGYDAAVEGGAS